MISHQLLINPEAPYLLEAQALYAPPDHATFEKVPPEFHDRIDAIYSAIGRPIVCDTTAWQIYMRLLERLEREDMEAHYLLGFVEDDPVPMGPELEAMQGTLDGLLPYGGRGESMEPPEGVDLAGYGIFSDDESEDDSEGSGSGDDGQF